MLYRLGEKSPKIGKNNFIAENSTLIGEIETGENVSVWFSAVLRGDCSKIVIGNNSNIQDNSTVHGDAPYPVIIGNNVTVGHNCVIHGCNIGDNVVVGMGTIILNGAKIPNNTIIGAGSLVTEKLEIPENCLVAGSPARVIRELNEKNLEYVKYAGSLYVKEIELYEQLEKI